MAPRAFVREHTIHGRVHAHRHLNHPTGSMSSRATAPVFVIGSPRSGTTLLYHMLLSAGGFAYYRNETHVFNSLAPRCGDLTRQANRDTLLDIWLPSQMHARSGLTAEDV